ncbi:MAG: hypothetical protein COB23_06530 [Methylophaga sp.]|nr:MAG: hypothetical protein COB23_06530 [Methylophaga sp.]
MKNYVLVHGAWGNAREFDDVVKLLSSEENSVTTIDLPGHGESHEPIEEVTMDAYVQRVIDTINQINGKVILVGHSLAGAVISQAAELIPEDIEQLIYVAAMLPKTGDSPLSLMQSDTQGELLPNIIFSEDQSYATLSDKDVSNLFLHDIDDKKKIAKLIPTFAMKQATQPFMAVAELSEEKFGSVPKYYIKARLDKVLTLSLQQQMISNWKVEQVVTLESGHFPLNSMPERLVKAIRMSENFAEKIIKAA